MRSILHCTVVLNLVFLLLLPPGASAQSSKAEPIVPDGAYSISERGAHHRTWQKVTELPRPDGTTGYRTNSYQELGTGMHFLKDGQWAETRAQF